jgi:hypothetical protein
MTDDPFILAGAALGALAALAALGRDYHRRHPQDAPHDAEAAEQRMADSTARPSWGWRKFMAASTLWGPGCSRVRGSFRSR